MGNSGKREKIEQIGDDYGRTNPAILSARSVFDIRCTVWNCLRSLVRLVRPPSNNCDETRPPLQVVDRKVAELNADMAIMQTARNTYAKSFR